MQLGAGCTIGVLSCIPIAHLQVSAPERLGAYEYYVQQMPGRPHPCYMRRVAHVAAPRSLSFSSTSNSRFSGGAPGGEVVLDVNDLAAVHGEYVQVGQVKLTRCGRHVAFTLDAGDGSEAFGAFTRDLRTGALRHLATVGSVVSLEWAADGRTLLCTQPNGLGRPWRVLGADAAAAAAGDGAASWPLFEEEDERFFVELGRTKDWRWGRPLGGGGLAPALVSASCTWCFASAPSAAYRLMCCCAAAAPAASSPSTATPRPPRRCICCPLTCAAVVQRWLLVHAWCSSAPPGWNTLWSTAAASCTSSAMRAGKQIMLCLGTWRGAEVSVAHL